MTKRVQEKLLPFKINIRYENCVFDIFIQTTQLQYKCNIDCHTQNLPDTWESEIQNFTTTNAKFSNYLKDLIENLTMTELLQYDIVIVLCILLKRTINTMKCLIKLFQIQQVKFKNLALCLMKYLGTRIHQPILQIVNWDL